MKEIILKAVENNAPIGNIPSKLHKLAATALITVIMGSGMPTFSQVPRKEVAAKTRRIAPTFNIKVIFFYLKPPNQPFLIGVAL